jgi:hypothetical protein
MSGNELRRKPVQEIDAKDMDSFIGRRRPFVVRGWLREKLRKDDPVWERTKARVIVIPPEAKGVSSVAQRDGDKKLVEMTYREVFDRIASEREGMRYYVFGDYTPAEVWKAIPWPKPVHGSTIYVTSGNTLSKAHFDFWNVFLIQVEGIKHWKVFAPSDYPFLYPVHNRVTGEVRRCLVDLEAPDFQTYPLLRKATCYELSARAGDLLYLPPRWWHEVRTGTFSVTVNASLYGSRLESAREIYAYFGHTLRARFVYRSSRHVALTTLLSPMTPHRLAEKMEATLGRFNDWRGRRALARK